MTLSQLNILQSLGWSILNSLWQMALLWVIYQLILISYKSIMPSLKSFFASFLLFTGFLWFIFTFLSAYFYSPSVTNPFNAIIEINQQNTITDYLYQLLPFISIVYLILLAISLTRYIKNYRYVQIISRFGLQKIHIDWRIFVKKATTQLGIKKSVQIWISELVTVPVTIGFLKPIILIPLAAINKLSVQQIEAVLLHEITHIRRNDFFINLIIQFIQTLLFFNPFVKAFIVIIEQEREICCDDMVLQFQYNKHSYATALYTLERFSFTDKPLILQATGNKSMLLSRIESIAGLKNKKKYSLKSFKLLLAGLFCIGSLNILLQPDKPGSGIKMFSITGKPATFISHISNKRNETLIPSNNENKKSVAITTTKKTDLKKEKEELAIIAEIPGIIMTDYEVSDIPNLKRYQEEQVNRSIEVSKKIVESANWEAIEKSLGEVFNQLEKDELRAAFHNKFNQFDWEKWRKKVKENYWLLNWDQLNNQLQLAENRLKIDSLQNTVSTSITRLEIMRNQIIEDRNSAKLNPTISLDELNQLQKNLIKLNKEIKNTRNKKIVHL